MQQQFSVSLFVPWSMTSLAQFILDHEEAGSNGTEASMITNLPYSNIQKANGTYIATTRRRRKRKQPAVKDDWTSVNKQQLNSEEEIEEELDDEGLDLDEYEDADAYEMGQNNAEQNVMMNVSNP